jgi:beta-lactamase regulating signal transducer with metallopeptidase domain
MNAVFTDPAMSTAVSIVVKATLLVGVAVLMKMVLHRRASAATRHLIWTLAVAGVLALPILTVALPEWTVTVPARAVTVAEQPLAAAPLESAIAAASDVETSAPLHAPAAPPARSISWSAAAAAVYAAGVVFMFIRLALQRLNVRRLAARGDAVQDAAWMSLLRECAAGIGVERPVRLLRSREHSMPMAFGTLRPAILIPSIADSWTEDRRRAVLLHELAHVARYDCLTQTLAMAACAVYWFHPAAWWVARQLRIERELACDDRVIAAGARARDYATHLLEIAYTLGRYRAPALAVSMARPKQLEGRMLAVLDAARNRRVPAARARMAGVAIAAALVVPLATGTITTAAPQLSVELAASAVAPTPGDHVPPPVEQSAAGPAVEQWRTIKSELRNAGRRVMREVTAAVREVQETLPGTGTWEVHTLDQAGIVQLQTREGRSGWGRRVELKELEGLTAAQLAAGGPVQFRMRRDAGTFTFEGVARNGVAGGTYTFTADPSFPNELAKRGFSRPTALEQYKLARGDVGFAFIDELTRQGYGKPALAELVRAGEHGVHTTYLREMGELGYKLGSLEPLIKLRDHGVTPRYVRDLAEQGFKGLSADDLRRARDHGVSAEYMRAMRDAGFGSLTMAELTRARDHGVTADYLTGMREAGYKLTLEQIIRARDHGVSPDYIRELRDAGHKDLALEDVIRVRGHGVTGDYMRGMRELGYGVSVNELVRARDHGVSVDFVREMAALGYGKLPLDQLIRARSHGVTAGYAREIKDLGYDKVPLDDLIALRSHGVTASRIRRANERAGTKLPLDMIKSLVSGGGL